MIMAEAVYLILALQVSITTFFLIYRGMNIRDDI
jgi:hypothetical protein